MPHQIIKIPLNSAIKRYFSASHYDSNVQQALGQLDFLYTYIFRYPKLLAVDIAGAQNTQGFTIDYIAANPLAGVTVSALFLAISLTTVISDDQKQQKENEKKVDQYRHTYHRVQARLSKSSLSLDNATLESSLDEIFNKSIEAKAFREKYKRIKITADGQVNLFKQELPVKPKSAFGKMGEVLSNVIADVWGTIGLASFAYWIMFIGWGVVSGQFSPAGIGFFGISGFMLPLAVAAVYPVLKIVDWMQYQWGRSQENHDGQVYDIEQNAQQQADAAADFAKLLRRVMYAKEKQRLVNELAKAGIVVPGTESAPSTAAVLDGDAKILKLGKRQWLKAAIVFITVSISSFIGAEYAAWIVSDFIQVAANISLNTAGFAVGFGTAFMVLSGLYGLYQAYQKYNEVEKYREEAEKISRELSQQSMSLDKIYQHKLDEIAQLKREISHLSKNVSDLRWLADQVRSFSDSKIIDPKPVDKPPKTIWATIKKWAAHTYAFLGGAMGGVTMARVATVAGTVTFLPFAAAALAIPYTIGIITVCGLIYGLLKGYQYHQARKEARAKALFEGRQENISCLQQQIELSDLQIKVLQAKRDSFPSGSLAPVAAPAPFFSLSSQKPYSSDDIKIGLARATGYSLDF